jgi:hypothetical protein
VRYDFDTHSIQGLASSRASGEPTLNVRRPGIPAASRPCRASHGLWPERLFFRALDVLVEGFVPVGCPNHEPLEGAKTGLGQNEFEQIAPYKTLPQHPLATTNRVSTSVCYRSVTPLHPFRVVCSSPGVYLAA